MTYACFYETMDSQFPSSALSMEVVVVMFIFFSDLAIVALRERGTDQFQMCIEWCVQYLSDSVCHWVRQQGGWVSMIQYQYAIKCSMSIYHI